MKRRDSIRLMPLVMANVLGFVRQAIAFEKGKQYDSWEDHLPLAFQYPKKIREMLLWVRMNQSENILEASYSIARAVLKGQTCWCYWNMGHRWHADIFPGRNGEPEILIPGYDPEKAKDGDLLLASFPFGQEIFDDLKKKDLFVIGAPAATRPDSRNYEDLKKEIQTMRVRPYADIWIDTPMYTEGTAVKLPGMPARMGPITGSLYMTIFWMMLADTCRILAIEGKPVKVKGDEPKLSGDRINWVTLADPLMDNFLEEVLKEMELIGSELGDLRKIATMVVDTVLNGGKVYWYSRYREAFSMEAYGRFGGFLFSMPAYDGHIEGTSKDCAVMGIYKPDDNVDLKNLDEFKKRGMRVASVGPISRDFKIPEGRTIQKETEAHIGRMCDTYGLYAIPGFEKKVCPTSGILNCVMLWTLSVEIAEQIIKRTNGNIPAIGISGALEKSIIQYQQMQVLYQNRGY